MISILLKGHDYEYEVSTLIKTFGFNKIEFVNSIDKINGEQLIINEIEKTNNKYIIKTYLYKNNEILSSKY